MSLKQTHEIKAAAVVGSQMFSTKLQYKDQGMVGHTWLSSYQKADLLWCYILKIQIHISLKMK